MLSGCAIMVAPFGSPSTNFYIAAGVGFNLFVSVQQASPLVLDYVIKEDRGKALSYATMGVSLGVIISLNGVFNLIKDIDPLIGWSIMGGLYIFFGFIMFIIIREPVDLEKKTTSVCF